MDVLPILYSFFSFPPSGEGTSPTVVLPTASPCYTAAMQTTGPRKRLQLARVLRGLRRAYYWVLLPSVGAYSLLVISGIQPRPLLWNSALFDFGVRLWITVWWCWAWLINGDLDRHERWFYGGRTLDDPDGYVDLATRMWNTGMFVLGSVLMALISRWVILTFLPALTNCAVPTAVVLGLSYGLPTLFRRHD